MQAVTRDQTHEIISRVVRNTPWGQLDGKALQTGVIQMSEEEFGRRFMLFLKNGANLVMKGLNALIIDPAKTFDSSKFIGSGWSIWRGAKDGDGTKGIEAQDAEALKLTEIDFSKVLFTSCLNDGEEYITGEEKLLRHAAAGHIRLTAAHGQALLEEEGQATLNWLYTTFGITWFELPGTVLRRADGDRCFLCLCRGGGGRWGWDCGWLDDGRGARSVSAVLGK